MGSSASDKMMELLKELSVLKELDRNYEASPNETERDDYQQRQQRKVEIAHQIKDVAEQNNAEES